MRGSSVVLITAGVMLTSATSALLLRIWLERRSFDMAARSPVLLIFVAVASLTMAVLVLLHWFLLLEGRGLGLPCYATFIASYFWYAFGVAPYMLRGVRIVVVYHSRYRYKYAGLVKWKKLRKTWAWSVFSIVVLAAIVFAADAGHYSDNYGCAFFDETLMLGVVMFTAGPGNMFLIYLFSQVNDAFKLRVEFIWIYAVISLATAEFVLIQGLYKTGAIAESRMVHLVMEISMLVVHLNNLFWLVLFSVARHDGWCGLMKSKITPTQRNVVSVQPKSSRISTRSSGPTYDGVLRYVEDGGPVAAMFERFCTRNLCAESWDFIVAACRYETLADAEEQFNTFVVIKEQYLQPTSPQEVNISCRMQAKIASMQDKTAFSALDEDSRRDILQAPLKEIVQMLEENLLAKFKQTPELLQWRENQKRQSILIRQAQSDKNMQELLLQQCSDFHSEAAAEEAGI